MAGSPPPGRRFSHLRGVRWRIDLSILPDSAAKIDELRRVAADSRRRYANLRRRLLIDPHLSKDEDRVPDLAVENPLSQNADSTWGKFFRNAELEKMLNQDLSRLYPEHEGFFQTASCQSMLGRILLVWTLRYPDCGYKQGMHEVLAPLLYVLHNDVEYFNKVRALHEDLFSDDFDGKSFPERLKMTGSDRNGSSQRNASKIRSLDDLDPDTRDLFLINDAYGAEGELGIILSEKFIEHDAYCMFECLLNGAQGVVAIADFYSLSPAPESNTGLTPIREATSAIYHLLSNVDSALHSHLIELGVEPQYFGLRWLRVLFGREFSLEKLLYIWDEIFSSSNDPLYTDMASREDYHYKVLCSPRGALMLSMAVSMMLHLRSSLLASEHATACLVRLLNFPEDADLKKLVDKAKLLQPFALETNIPSSSLKGGLLMASANFWEEKWKMLQQSEDLNNETQSGSVVGNKGNGIFSLPKSFSSGPRAKTMNNNSNDQTSRSQNDSGIVSGALQMPAGKGGPGKGMTEGIVNDSNGVGGGDHRSISAKVQDPLRTPHQQISRRSSAPLSNSTDSDGDIHQVQESRSSSDAEKITKSDSSSAANNKVEQSTSKAETLEDQRLENSSAGFVERSPADPIHSSTHEETEKQNPLVSSGSHKANKELMGTLRTLGESMLENIQVIEAFFNQDSDMVSALDSSDSALGVKEHSKAKAALQELRKISNLLRET